MSLSLLTILFNTTAYAASTQDFCTLGVGNYGGKTYCPIGPKNTSGFFAGISVADFRIVNSDSKPFTHGKLVIYAPMFYGGGGGNVFCPPGNLGYTYVKINDRYVNICDPGINKNDYTDPYDNRGNWEVTYANGGVRIVTDLDLSVGATFNFGIVNKSYLMVVLSGSTAVGCENKMGNTNWVKNGYCKWPGVSPGWMLNTTNSSGMWSPTTSSGETIYSVADISIADTDLDNSNPDYYDFEDFSVIIGIASIPSGPPCDAANDLSMSVNPSPQNEGAQSTFQVNINGAGVALTGATIDPAATAAGALQQNGNQYTQLYTMSSAIGSHPWTVNYTKTNGSGTSTCSKSSTFTIQEIPPPTCNYGTPYPIVGNPVQTNSGDLSMAVDPFPQTRFLKANFQITKSTQYDSTNPSRIGDLIIDMPAIPPQVSGCVNTLNDPSRKIYSCDMVGAEGTYQWSLTYHLFAKGKSPSGPSNTCVKTSVFGIQDPPGYLITHGGDVYLKNGINMPSYEKWGYATQCVGTNRNRCLSEFLWAANTNSSNCKNCSKKNYSKQGSYQDQNLSYINYNDILAMTLDKASKLPNVSVIKNVSSDSFSSTTQRIVVMNNDLTIGQGTANTLCDTPTIYFIPGDLNINPDFILKDSSSLSSKDKGCVFIIKGDLNISGGNNKGTNNYDLIHGFFILTENTSTVNIPQNGYELLRIVGGLVMRDININTIMRKTMPVGSDLLPTEVIEYEGQRYLNLFGDILLDNQAVYNINETPFINTFK
jgi:hypothetical protein